MRSMLICSYATLNALMLVGRGPQTYLEKIRGLEKPIGGTASGKR